MATDKVEVYHISEPDEINNKGELNLFCMD